MTEAPTSFTFRDALNVIFKRRYVAAVTLAVGLIGIVAYHFLSQREYSAVASVLVSNPGDVNNTGMTLFPSLIGSSTLLTRVETQLHGQATVAEMKKALKTRVRGSIVVIEYHDPSPLIAAAVPNAVADELVAYYTSLSTSRYDAETQHLQAEVERKRTALEALDKRLQQLATSSGLPLTADSATDSSSDPLASLEAARAQAYQAFVSDQAFAQSQSAMTAASAPEQAPAPTDPGYEAKVQQLERDEALLVTQRSQYTSNYPGLDDLASKVRRERAAVAQAKAQLSGPATGYSPSDIADVSASRKADAAVVADHARLDALDREISDQESRIAKLSSNGVAINTLRTERDAVKAEFIALTNNLASTLAAKATGASYGSVVVLDRAEVADIYGLAGKRLVLIQLGIVIALAIGSAFLAERIDPRPALPSGEERYRHAIVADGRN